MSARWPHLLELASTMRSQCAVAGSHVLLPIGMALPPLFGSSGQASCINSV